MVRIILVATAALFVAACSRGTKTEDRSQLAPAAQSKSSRDAIGRIYHYVRSNIDGTEREDVYVFRRKRDTLEVYKARQKCANAALVTAKLDMDAGYAPEITGGRLLPGGKHEDFAFLTFDPKTKELSVRVELPDQDPLVRSVTVEKTPFHVYDFDFASLTVMTPHLGDPTAEYSFGLAMVIPDPAREDFLLYLGEAVMTYRGEETHGDRPAFRYAVGGPAFGSFGGTLWLDAEEGHILDVETGIPNHLEYHDFKLKLAGIDDGGVVAWTKLLTAHFEGCE